MVDLAIIGGTGLTSLDGLEIVRREVVHTPFGEPSGPLTHGMLNGKEVLFLARHGYGHTIPPHRINYRANLWALHHAGIKRVIAVAAVGGIHDDLPPGALAIPDQIIDYTWGRPSTYFEDDLTEVTHIDFSYPYCDELRALLIDQCKAAGLNACETGTYGATQGPRLETAAEIARMGRDGCTMVGMTGMPEAVLARELDLNYACCAVSANWAAGKGDGSVISMAEIEENLKTGMESVRKVLQQLLSSL
ncbi:MAG: S-methyl-5'-thioinosine phosphorylase [Thiotrichaceae bacterium]|nr:S-methyl-5'-thioinosine phosphorylase [Thiotrichaceae bacterium]PCI13937.1 MAG: 5'-methylthioadenosine phosphorylase [Thiotrichales bacterium]